MLKNAATSFALLLALAASAFAGGANGFPLPKDAGPGGAAPGGGGKIQVFNVPRGKDAVLAELRAQLKADGWTTEVDQTSPRGAVRLELKKGTVVIKASLTGDASRTAIILTLP